MLPTVAVFRVFRFNAHFRIFGRLPAVSQAGRRSGITTFVKDENVEEFVSLSSGEGGGARGDEVVLGSEVGLQHWLSGGLVK